MADRIFVGQESLEIRLDTNIDISGATSVLVGYEKPDGTQGEWTATRYNSTTVSKAFAKDDGLLTPKGVWLFWSIAVMSDGRRVPGTPVRQKVYAEGSLT